MILFPLVEASRSAQAHESGESRKNILRQFEASAVDILTLAKHFVEVSG